MKIRVILSELFMLSISLCLAAVALKVARAFLFLPLYPW
jgi:hypothetical protein